MGLTFTPARHPVLAHGTVSAQYWLRPVKAHSVVHSHTVPSPIAAQETALILPVHMSSVSAAIPAAVRAHVPAVFYLPLCLIMTLLTTDCHF